MDILNQGPSAGYTLVVTWQSTATSSINMKESKDNFLQDMTCEDSSTSTTSSRFTAAATACAHYQSWPRLEATKRPASSIPFPHPSTPPPSTAAPADNELTFYIFQLGLPGLCQGECLVGGKGARGKGYVGSSAFEPRLVARLLW